MSNGTLRGRGIAELKERPKEWEMPCPKCGEKILVRKRDKAGELKKCSGCQSLTYVPFGPPEGFYGFCY